MEAGGGRDVPSRRQFLGAAASGVVLAGASAGESQGASPYPRAWLTTAGTYRARAEQRADDLAIENGLVRRTVRIRPNAATIAFDNLVLGTAMIRGVKPEARVSLDGVVYDVGGLLGQPDYAYLDPQWLAAMRADATAFSYAGFSTGTTQLQRVWGRSRFSPESAWPLPGAALQIDFVPPRGAPDVRVSVHYEIYDDAPLLAKWVTVDNHSARSVRLDSCVSEILAVVENETPLIVESEYAFGGSMTPADDHAARWHHDPQFVTKARGGPSLLEVTPPIGPAIDVKPGERFTSPRVFELALDATDRESVGLSRRRMYRAIAPWVQENPIYMHVVSIDANVVKNAIDQAAAVGFEMVILSFGSGLNMESTDPAHIAHVRVLADYARSKHIVLGGYSLLASRRIDDANDVIDPKTGMPDTDAVFGHSPCLGSAWGLAYFRKIKAFIEQTGLGCLEHDGSYPGDLCASTVHPGHRDVRDSQWRQWEIIRAFYGWCRERGVYLNVPDWYFLSGSNKTGMGYREQNWSLPRAFQYVHGRQNIFDGTWEKTPSMGWMFCPLVEYEGGGAAATIEPLHEHLDAYGQFLAQNFGAGVQAAYRGMRLYDTPETEELVRLWTSFYRRHRTILDSDIVHVARADGRNVDAILHVNPRGAERALAMLFNPAQARGRRRLELPLAAAGLSGSAVLSERDGPNRQVRLQKDATFAIDVSLAPRSVTWFVFSA